MNGAEPSSTLLDVLGLDPDTDIDDVRSFDFRALIRLADCASPDKPSLGDALHLRDESIRLSQHVTQAFQGTALHRIEAAQGTHHWRLYCNFLGLLGSNGPLPLHYTEYADTRARHAADPTFRDFIDLFNHRLLSLFYKASVQFDPVVNRDRLERDDYDAFLGALGGFMLPASQRRDSVNDSIRCFHAAWFGAKSKSPDGVTSLLSDYFCLPVQVREFAGDWLTLPQRALTSLGSRRDSTTLGLACYIGRRVWSVAHKFVIALGPLDWADFQSFKPGGERARALHDLVRSYVGDEWDWDLELQVASGRVSSLRLDRQSALGFDCWLTGSRSRELPSQRVCINRQLLRSESAGQSIDAFDGDRR